MRSFDLVMLKYAFNYFRVMLPLI
uniref:Uncharacterized protein n=1 Tax=Arundo donax TaxID=35708 RepID=A0A0A9BRJ2_ARUDO